MGISWADPCGDCRTWNYESQADSHCQTDGAARYNGLQLRLPPCQEGELNHVHRQLPLERELAMTAINYDWDEIEDNIVSDSLSVCSMASLARCNPTLLVIGLTFALWSVIGVYWLSRSGEGYTCPVAIGDHLDQVLYDCEADNVSYFGDGSCRIVLRRPQCVIVCDRSGIIRSIDAAPGKSSCLWFRAEGQDGNH